MMTGKKDRKKEFFQKNAQIMSCADSESSFSLFQRAAKREDNMTSAK